MRPAQLDLALHLLDDQLIDSQGQRCGRVDDVELRGGAAKHTRIAALISGVGAWPNRLPRRLGPALRGLTPPFAHRIPWDAVADVVTTVKLSRSRTELGLRSADGRNVLWLGKAVEDGMLASTLLGRTVVNGSGTRLGRVRDMQITRLTDDPSPEVREDWIVSGLLIGRRGVLQRFGFTRRERRSADTGATPPNFVPWENVVDLEGDAIRVSVGGD
jgi:sporulation protein YlmC with PRC-barrel domain